MVALRVVLCGLLVSAVHCSIADAALVAYWPANGNAADASGNGHNGSVDDSTFAPGVAGQAFSFDGTNNPILVPADPALEPTPFSISMFVRSAIENHFRILADSTHGAGQAGWALQIDTANNLRFAYGNGTTFPEIASSFNSSLGADFHHVAATFDGTTMQFYVDGSPTTSGTYTGTPLPSGRDIQIGSSLAISPERAFEGELDDIRIYNHTLTPEEVRFLASVPEPSSLMLLGGLAAFAAGVYCHRRR